MKFKLFIVLFIGSALLTSCGQKNEEGSTVDNNNIDSLIGLYPDSLPLLLKKSEMLIAESMYGDALNFAAKSFRLDSTNETARMLYAKSLNNRPERTTQDILTARRHFQTIVNADSLNKEAFVQLGLTFTQLSEFDQAFVNINKALRIDKKFRDAYVAKGTTYRMEIVNIESEIQSIGNEDQQKVGALAREIKERWDLMKSSYETAVQQDPEFFEAYFELGRIYQMEGDKICIEYFTTAHELKPEIKEIEYYLAFSKQHYGQGPQVEDARSMYRQMATGDEEEKTCEFTSQCVSYPSLALFQLGHLKQFYDNDLDSAIYFYNSATKSAPDFVEAYHNMGMCYDLKGNKTQALKKFGQALKFDPEYTLSREYADRIK